MKMATAQGKRKIKDIETKMVLKRNIKVNLFPGG